MRFYDSTINLRNTAAWDASLIHSRLDYYIQEKLKCKLPYSFHAEEKPHTQSSDINIRSAIPLGLPGESENEHFLRAGQDVRFKVRIYSGTRPRELNKKINELNKIINGSEEWFTNSRAPMILKHAGFKVLHAKVIEQGLFRVTKQKQESFHIPYYDAAIGGVITDTASFEKALVKGVGKKRIYGLGMIREIDFIDV